MRTQSADALVVHGHGLTPEEALDLHTTQRMDIGLAAWHEGAAQNFAVTGGYSFMLKTPPSKTEGSVMGAYALQRGIPAERLFVEDKSLETVGNVLFTKTTLAVPNDWESLLVDTSASHLARTLRVYRHIFGPDYRITGIAAPERAGLKEKIWEPLGAAMVHEVLRGTKAGDHDAIQERLFDLVPGYGGNGTVRRLAIKSLTGLLKKS